MSKKPHSALDEEDVAGEAMPAPKDEASNEQREKRRRSRLAMTLEEAEIIARNLKESGTRR